jgi:NAD(P)-dependent dehydrogenase (short-subunit alcohol dehydrogenase family)
VQNHFKVAVGSRSGVDVTNGKAFPVKVDVSDAAEISGAFKETEKNLGALPNVVIYNGKHLSFGKS